jgi:hypothetical protein
MTRSYRSKGSANFERRDRRDLELLRIIARIADDDCDLRLLLISSAQAERLLVPKNASHSNSSGKGQAVHSGRSVVGTVLRQFVKFSIDELDLLVREIAFVGEFVKLPCGPPRAVRAGFVRVSRRPSFAGRRSFVNRRHGSLCFTGFGLISTSDRRSQPDTEPTFQGGRSGSSASKRAICASM